MMDPVTAESMPSERRATVRTRALVGVGVLLYAWVGSGFRELTWPATVAVIGPATWVVVLVIRRPTARPNLTARQRHGVLVWSALLAAALLWEAYAFFQQPALTVGSHDHPTLSTLLDPVMQNRAAKFVGWVIWLRVGMKLVRS